MVSVEDFFKELNSIALAKQQNRLTRKDLQKKMSELLKEPRHSRNSLSTERMEKLNAMSKQSQEVLSDDEDEPMYPALFATGFIFLYLLSL